MDLVSAAVTVFLVRHGSAGHRNDRNPSDHERHLDDSGRRQAQKLRAYLAPHDIGSILSSPYPRCVQTVEPLARSCEVEIELSDALAEGANIEDSWALLEKAALSEDDVVLCSHGDVIPDLIRRAGLRGMSVPDGAGCAKGSVWAVQWDGERFAHASYTRIRD